MVPGGASLLNLAIWSLDSKSARKLSCVRTYFTKTRQLCLIPSKTKILINFMQWAHLELS